MFPVFLIAFSLYGVSFFVSYRVSPIAFQIPLVAFPLVFHPFTYIALIFSNTISSFFIPSWAGSRRQWRTGKNEKTGCEIIFGAPTTLAVKGLMMMMMIILNGKSDLVITAKNNNKTTTTTTKCITALTAAPFGNITQPLIISYTVEVWGILVDNDPTEKVHFFACERFSIVGGRTSNKTV